MLKYIALGELFAKKKTTNVLISLKEPAKLLDMGIESICLKGIQIERFLWKEDTFLLTCANQSQSEISTSADCYSYIEP